MATVNITRMKEKAIRFSEPVKTLILSEKSVMNSDEFIIKICQWLKLTEMRGGPEK